MATNNDNFDDAVCLTMHEAASGRRKDLSEGTCESSRTLIKNVEQESGLLPDVIIFLEVYLHDHPDVAYEVARKNVLAATESVSEGGLNPLADGPQLEDARNKAAALLFEDAFEASEVFKAVATSWLHMKFVAEHPEAADLDEKNAGLFARWTDKRFAVAKAAGK